MKKLICILFVLLFVTAGCQMDIQGPAITAKVLYKGENGNREYLSRGSGQTGGSSYSAGGSSGYSWSFGNAKNDQGQQSQQGQDW